VETIDWTYAISTLIIRFVGIFVVLGVLQIIMQLTGRIFTSLDAKQAARQPSKSPAAPSPGLTPEEAAALAVALHLHSSSQRPG